jgi:hypothetical protein
MVTFRIATTFFIFMISVNSIAQTCTITDPDGNPATETTVNWAAATCSETGLAPVPGNSIIVPVGVNLNLPNNGSVPTSPTSFFTGNITIFGRMTNNRAQALLNGSIVVKNGGVLSLNRQLQLGLSPGCGYTLIVESGGLVELTGSGASDRLSICGQPIMQSSGGCNPYPAGPPPYCQPPGGFTGPTGFDENGYNSTLPVSLVYFTAHTESHSIYLEWATEKEEGFDRFIIQRAHGDFSFEDIGEVWGAGYDTYSLRKYSFVDERPQVGISYYRLKAIDIDGSAEYFGPVSQPYFDRYAIWVSPNPSSGDFVGFQTNFRVSEGDRVQIISSWGAVVADVPASETNGRVPLAHSLKPGVYFLKYSSATGSAVVRFVVAY